jgi:hypothetical protein
MCIVDGIECINLNRENSQELGNLKEKFLYRYMSLEHAIQLFENKELVLVTPSKWIDPFEKRFLEAKYKMNTESFNFPYKNNLYCMCMTRVMINEACWNTYAKDEIGIELVFNIAKLIELLKKKTMYYNIFIGKVEYMRTDEIMKEPIIISSSKEGSLDYIKSWVNPFFWKRMAYTYEQEVRLIIVKKNKCQGDENDGNDEKNSSGILKIKFSCDNTELIDRIIIDPRVGKNLEKLLKKEFENYGFSRSESGKYHVVKSSLYNKLSKAEIKIEKNKY